LKCMSWLKAKVNHLEDPSKLIPWLKAKAEKLWKSFLVLVMAQDRSQESRRFSEHPVVAQGDSQKLWKVF